MADLSLVQAESNKSPFDAIRQTDQDGEYWLARDLMPMLGYPRWQDFEDAIGRAKASCENAGNSILEHFSGLTLKTHGRPKQDYRLSRYACYLTAQNGDPRKPEVAAAQSYFAAKTREAETRQPAIVQRLLPPVRDVIEYIDAKKFIDSCPDPLFRSVANQRLLEEMGATKLLAASPEKEQVLVAVRAKQLGYGNKQIGDGSRLGAFVKKVLPPNGKTQHGRYEVNVYDLTPELDEVIHAFFR